MPSEYLLGKINVLFIVNLNQGKYNLDLNILSLFISVWVNIPDIFFNTTHNLFLLIFLFIHLFSKVEQL